MKKNIIVKQHDNKDCGICCLESIIIYYGGYIPLETLRLKTKTSNNGTTAYNITKVAKEIGFETKGIKTNKLSKEEIILPAIAHLETKKGFNHFVVIYKITNKYVYIMDPAHGYKKIDKSMFEEEWTNILLFLKLIEDNKRIIIKMIFINGLTCIFSILSSYYLKIIMNLIEETSKNMIGFIMAIFLGITLYKIILEYIKNELSIYLNKNIDCTLIPEFIEHIFKIPSDVITTHTSGEILTRVNAMRELKDIFRDIIVSILLNITLIATSLCFLYELNHKLCLILCLISLIYIIFSLLTNIKIIEYINDNIDKETNFNSNLVENIDAIETINHLNMKDYIIDKIDNYYYDVVKTNFEYSNIINKIITLKNIINDLGLYIITTIGILLLIKEQITILSLITFISIMNYYIEPIETIVSQIPLWNKINLNIEKISDFLDFNQELHKEQQFQNGDIILKNITYSYDDYQNIIDNLNIEIKENDRVEIKGPSGCGKSTICKMLNHTIKDYKGTIKINGVDLKNYAPNIIRKNIVYVSQREKLFTDTIRNNIVLEQEKKETELEKVIEITKVQEIVDKKGMKLDSMLLDSGINLSGGERQRIILARSIIRKPKILILDESLSEIDKEKERQILKDISDYLKKTTIIYISHNENKIFDHQINIKGNNNVKIINAKK